MNRIIRNSNYQVQKFWLILNFTKLRILYARY